MGGYRERDGVRDIGNVMEGEREGYSKSDGWSKGFRERDGGRYIGRGIE